MAENHPSEPRLPAPVEPASAPSSFLGESGGLLPVPDDLFRATTQRGMEPGQILFGRFKLERILGRGGMGVVWLAHDEQLEQNVAIKVLPDLVMHDPEAVGEMKRETKRSLQLNHHQIVRIYDFNQDAEGAGISMEYVEGLTLSAAKAQRAGHCFDVEQLGPWVEQICDALGYAHEKARIVHRDLKPANIMLATGGIIKVTDFGIARSLSDSVSRVSMRHATSGTMVYMSPQQSAGARSTPSDDIYSLGATIYDLMTGKPPFHSGNIQHQLESVTPRSMAERRAELDRFGGAIPRHWEVAVAACLEKEPSRRPASVGVLAEMLDLRVAAWTATAIPATNRPLPEPLTISTPMGLTQVLPPVRSAPSARTLRRRRMLLIGGASLAGLVGGGAGLAAWIGQGTLQVTTEPAGAEVALGGTRRTSPARFENLWSGTKTLAISAPGYDPLTEQKTVKKDLVLNTHLRLHRSQGQAEVSTIPDGAEVTLKLIDSPVAGEVVRGDKRFSTKGWGAFRTAPLVTGRYEATARAPGFPDAVQTVELTRNGTVPVALDLVQQRSLHLLPAEAVLALSQNQAIPAELRQDTAARAGLSAFYAATWRDYAQANEYRRAFAALQNLALTTGTDPVGERSRLLQSELAWTKERQAECTRLIAQKRFVSARRLIDRWAARSTLPPDPQLVATLAQAQAAQERALAKTLASVEALQRAGQNGEAYRLVQEQAAALPEPPLDLILAEARLELALPASFERVSTRQSSLLAAGETAPEATSNPEYANLCAVFTGSLARHGEFRAQLAALDEKISADEAAIGQWRAQIKRNRDKANGYRALGVLGLFGGIAAAADGSAAGAVAGVGTGAVGAEGATARQNDVDRQGGDLREVQAHRADLVAQRRTVAAQYAAFVAAPIGDASPVVR